MKKMSCNDCIDFDELFDEYETDTIAVGDFNVLFQGALVQCIHRDCDGNVSIWSGDPDDKFSEELLPSKAEKKEILETIWEYMA